MLSQNDTGLIIVDIQGKLAEIVHQSESVIANATVLAKGANCLGLPIVWLEQNPSRLGATTASLSDALGDYQPIPKMTFDGSGADAFNEAIEKAGVKSWLICGIETHICVYQTAMSLLKKGYNVEIVSDCVASRTAQNKDMAITKLLSKGAGVTSLEMCLFEMIGDCRSPAFKDVLRLIK